MYYIGVDLHKETSWFYIVDAQSKKYDSKNIQNKPEILKSISEQIPKPFTLAVEATYNWYFFVDLAEQYALKVFLANSYELKAFAKRHKRLIRLTPDSLRTFSRKDFYRWLPLLIKKPDKYVNYFGIGSIWLPTDHEIFLDLRHYQTN